MTGMLIAGTSDSRRLRLDPRTKLLLLVVINAVMMGGGLTGMGMVVRPVLSLIPLALLLAEGRVRPVLIFLPVFALATLTESFLVPNTSGIANLLAVIFSGLVTRFLPGLMTGYYVVTTTTVSEFIAAMERMRVSSKIVIPLSVMFRFFPTVVEEARAIGDSMRMRGLGGGAIIKNPVAALEYRVVPLMACVVKIGDELSAAALTRGLGGPVRRTNICEIGFRWQDAAIFLAAMAAAASMLLR